jgi:hypothetical protein
MSITSTILIRSFVKPYYRQHAGFFIFIFIIFFGVVGVVDGAGILAFHYSLIRSILVNPSLLLLLLFLWTLYAKKCEQSILNVLWRPAFSFLNILSLLEKKILYRQMFAVQVLLFLPVIVYAIVICIVGIYHHVYIAGGIIFLFITSICLLSVKWYLYVILNPGLFTGLKSPVPSFKSTESAYWILFIRFIGKYKKLFFAGIKLFNCGILYGMLVNQTGTRSETDMIILFYCLSILGHGLLIHQLRELEETKLTFYRSLPISLFKRFIQYVILYFILLLPEIITLGALTPKYLHYQYAFQLIFFGFSILLFLNSLLFIQFFSMKQYLKIILCIFFLIYLSVLTGYFFLFCIFLFLASGYIFFGRYYQYERQISS